jgi:acyl-CoA thioester hydrolase
MFSVKVTPRFGDIDMLGHINNIIPSHWFELARTPIMKIFDPELKLTRETFQIIMAHTEYDFIDQIFFQYEVEVKTWISKIGNKSFTVYHEAWQQGRLCVKGKAIIVHYDFATKQTTSIPDDKRKLLAEHLLPDENE